MGVSYSDTKLIGVRMGIVTEFCKSVVTFRVVILLLSKRELFYYLPICRLSVRYPMFLNLRRWLRFAILSVLKT